MWIKFWNKLIKKHQLGKLRVLMYHKVSETKTDALTVTVRQLEEQLIYLQQGNYQIIGIKEFLLSLEKNTPIHPQSVLLTFDDGYLNNLLLAYPILQKYQAKATVFLPTAFIGKTSAWDENAEQLMNVKQLKGLETSLIAFGLHSHNHQNFSGLNSKEIQKEIENCINFFQENQLDFVPALAYPYGGRPKNVQDLAKMKQILKDAGVKLGFRIGNRLNSLPIKDVFEIERLDIRGTDSFEEFKQKIMVGKLF